MAFIYCDVCGWGQDDFWQKEGYTPFRKDIVDHLKESLFKGRVIFDDGFFKDHPELVPDGRDEFNRPYVDGRKYVAWDLRRRASRIEKMVYRTSEEWNSKGEARWDCPSCGAKQGLRID
jgi:hypothetical protein